MNNNFSDDNGLERFLNSFSLFLIGSLRVTDGDRVADISDNVPSRQLFLIGNGGSSFWPNFSQSQEFEDGLADPLDRWSRRVGNLLADKMGGRAFFPFEGPPHRPFLSWASKTGKVASSRLSLFIHEQYGLWHAYRFALALPDLRDESPVGDTFISPCLSCEDKPCLNACPVNAFAGASYRADLCMDYLVGDHTSACRELGCAARRACPVGKAFTYTREQAKFHMDAFVKPRIM